MLRIAIPLLALLPTLACASVIQPGFADPGGVHAPAAGATTVAVHGGAIGEAGFPGIGGGGAVRVTHQLEDGRGFGGEVFGGGGTMTSNIGPYSTPSPVMTGGARGFIDHRPDSNVLVRAGASASATTTANNSDFSPVALLDATFAIAPKDVGAIEPYAFAGLSVGAMGLQGAVQPLAGVHLGAGARVALGDAWHAHSGVILESRSVLHPSTLGGFISPTAIVSVGVSHTF